MKFSAFIFSLCCLLLCSEDKKLKQTPHQKQESDATVTIICEESLIRLPYAKILSRTVTRIDNFGLALQSACTCLCETLCIREERTATNLKKYEAENVSIIPQPSEHNGENSIYTIELPMNFSNVGEMMVLPINEVVNMFQKVAKMYTDFIKYVLVNKSPVYIFEQNLKTCEKNINIGLIKALSSVNKLHKIYLLYKQPVIMNEVNYVLFKKNMRLIKYTHLQANFYDISGLLLGNLQQKTTSESPGTSINSSSSISTNRMCNKEIKKSEREEEEDPSTINSAQ